MTEPKVLGYRTDPPTIGSDWLTLDEAALFLKTTVSFIKTGCKEKKLQHVQTSRGKIFNKYWLDDFMYSISTPVLYIDLEADSGPTEKDPGEAPKLVEKDSCVTSEETKMVDTPCAATPSEKVKNSIEKIKKKKKGKKNK